MLLDPIAKPRASVPPVADAARALPRHWSESVNLEKPSAVTFDTVQRVQPVPMMIAEPRLVKALGRPRKVYKPEYANELVELMLEGYSFSACAGFFGVSYETLYAWCDEYPEMAKARARGKSARLATWESHAIEVMRTGGTGSQVNMIYNGLKNQGSSEWREKQEVQHSGAISLARLVESSLKNITPRQPIEIEGESVPMLETHSQSGA